MIIRWHSLPYRTQNTGPSAQKKLRADGITVMPVPAGIVGASVCFPGEAEDPLSHIILQLHHLSSFLRCKAACEALGSPSPTAEETCCSARHHA